MGIAGKEKFFESRNLSLATKKRKRYNETMMGNCTLLKSYDLKLCEVKTVARGVLFGKTGIYVLVVTMLC